MTPTGSPKRRSSAEHISGAPRADSTIVGTRHASVGIEAAVAGLTPARRKGKRSAVHHGCRGAMGWGCRGGPSTPLPALDLGAPSAAAAAARTVGCAHRREGRCRGGHGDSGGGRGGGRGLRGGGFGV